VLSLDGSREAQHDQLEDSTSGATVHSILDHYMHQPSNTSFVNITLLHFAQNYSMAKELGGTPKQHKMKVVGVGHTAYQIQMVTNMNNTASRN